MRTTQFQDAIREHDSSLKAYAMHLTRNPDDAEDLYQDTMYKAFRYTDKFTMGTNLKAWLCTIMRNNFINAYRKRKKQNTILDSTDNNYFINSGAVTRADENEAGLVNDDIRDALQELPEYLRIPFMGHYTGFKYTEIAEELEIPLGTVKSRIFLARKQLQKNLRTYGEYYGLAKVS